MKKIFNKKLMKVYIALLCLCFVSAIVSAGLTASYSSKITKLQKENKTSSSLSDASSVEDLLTGALTSLLQKNIQQQADKQIDKSSPEQRALESKKTTSIIVMSVTLVLGVLFSAGAITSYQYEKYLLSDKYKAKLKRLKKYEKAKR